MKNGLTESVWNVFSRGEDGVNTAQAQEDEPVFEPSDEEDDGDLSYQTAAERRTKRLVFKCFVVPVIVAAALLIIQALIPD